jgi:ketosteroid isomerase-like protein
MPERDRTADVAAVRGGIEASNRGDLDAVLELFDPEIEFHIAPGLGNAGTYRGHAGYREGFEGWADAWDDFTIEILDVQAVGDRHIAVDARQSARGHGSGVEVEMRLGYMFELRDGKVVRLHILHDRDSALAAAEAGERATG